jgi:hypothetical protein
LDPLLNVNGNRWSAHARGTTCFLPVNDLTFMYVNGLLEILNGATGAFLVDERNRFRPAGLAKFARSRGGHLDDDLRNFRVVSVRQVEQFVTEFVTIEQGMMLENLGLMALGLGGFPNFANHECGWFQALGFRMSEMPASRYLGAGRLVSLAMRLLKQNVAVPYPSAWSGTAKLCSSHSARPTTRQWPPPCALSPRPSSDQAASSAAPGTAARGRNTRTSRSRSVP